MGFLGGMRWDFGGFVAGLSVTPVFLSRSLYNGERILWKSAIWADAFVLKRSQKFGSLFVNSLFPPAPVDYRRIGMR